MHGNQTAFIFASVFAAFVFWITVRGDLPKWLGMLGLASTANAGPVGDVRIGVPQILPALPALPSLGGVPGGAPT